MEDYFGLFWFSVPGLEVINGLHNYNSDSVVSYYLEKPGRESEGTRQHTGTKRVHVSQAIVWPLHVTGLLS